MLKILLFFSFLFLAIGCSTAFRPVLIDNKIEKNEWNDAKTISLNTAYSLIYKQDQFYYYLAVKRIDENPIYIDIFLSINNNIYNIHASQQLGERALIDTTWTDREPQIRWGIHKGWTASVVLVDRAKIRKLRKEKVEINKAYMQSIIPYDGYEFQFSKSEWDLKNAKMRIEIRHMFFPEEFHEVIFPSNSERKNTENWYNLTKFFQ